MNLLQSLQKSLSNILKFSDHSVEGYFGSGIFCFGFINASSIWGIARGSLLLVSRVTTNLMGNL